MSKVVIETLIISQRTKYFIEQLRCIENNSKLLPWFYARTKKTYQLNYLEVMFWLQTSNGSKNSAVFRKSRFIRESLRAALLQDLDAALYPRKKKKEAVKKKSSWYAVVGFFILGIGGALFSICDGFDGITAILGLFTSIPVWVVFTAGIAFSLLSVAVYVGFDLVEISKNLGVDLPQSPKLLDVLIEQTEQIDLLRKHIKQRLKVMYADKMGSTAPSVSELQALQALVAMLRLRYAALDDARKTYTHELSKTYLTVMKFIVAAIAGVLFFSYGFFSGQSLVTAILNLCGMSVTVFAWPVILISIAIGLAAFGQYWFVERPGLENLVGRWCGVDQDKITQLADPDAVAQQKKKLQRLENEIGTKLVAFKTPTVEKTADEPFAKQTSFNARRAQAMPVRAQDLPMFSRRARALSTSSIFDDVKLRM